MLQKKYRIIVLLAFFLFNQNLFSDNIVVKLGAYIPIKMTLQTNDDVLNYGGESDQELYTSANYLFNVSYQKMIFKIKGREIRLGGGIAYEGEARSQDKFQGMGFANIPVFGKLSFDCYKNNNFKLDSYLDLGYNIVDITSENFSDWDEKKGGLYFACGVAFLFDKSNIIDFSYSLTNNRFSEFNSNGSTVHNDYSYSKFIVTIGRMFSF